MVLRIKHFYKTCAIFPTELSEPSPLKSHCEPLKDSPIKGNPIRVSEDTGMWYVAGVKLGKPRTCYLAEYDPNTSIGVVFLGTSTPHEGTGNRFVPVHGGPWIFGSACLRIVPDYAFQSQFYLNITHPLRVQIVHLPMGSGFGALKGMRRVPPGPPPPIGTMEYKQIQPSSQAHQNLPVLVRLDSESESTFWDLHKAYHKTRPRTFITGSGGEMGSSGGEMGGSGGEMGGSGGEMGGSGGEKGGLTDADAPWGRIGCFRIGLDIPLIAEDNDREESETEEDEDGGEALGKDCTDCSIGLMDFGVDDLFVRLPVLSDENHSVGLGGDFLSSWTAFGGFEVV